MRLTVKRGKKRVYKSVKVLKRQCANKKKKKVKRKRKFGSSSSKQKLNKIKLFGGNYKEDTNGQIINHILPNGKKWTQYFIPVYNSKLGNELAEDVFKNTPIGTIYVQIHRSPVHAMQYRVTGKTTFRPITDSKKIDVLKKMTHKVWKNGTFIRMRNTRTPSEKAFLKANSEDTNGEKIGIRSGISHTQNFIPVIDWVSSHIPLSGIPISTFLCGVTPVLHEYWQKNDIGKYHRVKNSNEINFLKKMTHKFWNGRFYTKIGLKELESQIQESKNRLKGKRTSDSSGASSSSSSTTTTTTRFPDRAVPKPLMVQSDLELAKALQREGNRRGLRKRSPVNYVASTMTEYEQLRYALNLSKQEATGKRKNPGQHKQSKRKKKLPPKVITPYYGRLGTEYQTGIPSITNNAYVNPRLEELDQLQQITKDQELQELEDQLLKINKIKEKEGLNKNRLSNEEKELKRHLTIHEGLVIEQIDFLKDPRLRRLENIRRLQEEIDNNWLGQIKERKKPDVDVEPSFDGGFKIKAARDPKYLNQFGKLKRKRKKVKRKRKKVKRKRKKVKRKRKKVKRKRRK